MKHSNRTSKSFTNNRRFLVVGCLTVLLLGYLSFRPDKTTTEDSPPRDSSTRKDVGHKFSAIIPNVKDADVPDEELSAVINTVIHTNRWFNELPYGRIEYEVVLTKSEAKYDQDVSEAKASFPDVAVNEARFPTYREIWTMDQSIVFGRSRLTCGSNSEACGNQSETWDGVLLTGFVDHGGSQEPNYYLASDVQGSMTKLGWLPRVGPTAIWFHDETKSDEGLSWAQGRPTHVGATQFADRDSLVFRDSRNHWIVGRDDRKLYGRYSRSDWEKYSQHQEVADGVFWPMKSIRRQYRGDELQWTARITVKLVDTKRQPKDSDFHVAMRSGVKVCDLRHDYAVVYTSDPRRTEDELAEIYSRAKEQHEERSRTDVSRRLIGKAAPHLGSGKWLHSEPISLSAMRGKRSVQIGFGFTACAPCGNMLAMFSKRQETSTDQLVLVFAASDSLSDIEKKLSQYNLKCATFIPDDESGFGEVFERYQVTSYPTVVTVDIDGNIASHQVGTLAPPE